MKKVFLVLIVVAAAVVFVPQLRYKTYAPGEGPYAARTTPETTTRVDRLTGDIDILESSGTWRHIGNARVSVVYDQSIDQNDAYRSDTDNRKLQEQSRHSIESTQAAVDEATRQ